MAHKNIILDTDSYKASHFLQYPPGTEYVYSYIEARGGGNATLFYGLQPILDTLATKVTLDDVREANELFTSHGLPFPLEAWTIIANELQGNLPLSISAVPEGTLVPVSHPLVTITNTDKRFPWLVSWFETALLRVWYPTSVATTSYEARQHIVQAFNQSSDESVSGSSYWTSSAPFKLHDFGSRGVSSDESAAIGGSAHLVNFLGSDTVVAISHLRKYYKATMPAYSIPAAEHSTITSWGKDNEELAYANMVEKFSKPGSIYAVVSDSYDLFNAVSNIWGDTLKTRVQESGGTLVVRPDSGNPLEIVPTTLTKLDEKYGSTVNSKGYKVLNTVRVIQGDGVTSESLPQIIDAVLQAGFSIDNIAFGMGGGLLQHINRDTYKFAYKCSAISKDGIWYDVFKDPVTDKGKRSKKGLVATFRNAAGEFKVGDVRNEASNDFMVLYFLNGELHNSPSLETIRGINVPKCSQECTCIAECQEPKE